MRITTVALIGPRGAGKTTIGRALAAGLGWDFCDADAELATAVGRAAGDYLREVGEAAFRAREVLVSAPLLERDRTVVALGGGAVLSPVLGAALARPHCLPVLLLAPAAELARRIRADPAMRPPLTALPFEREVEQVLAERLPRYRALARIECDTGGRSPDAVTQDLLTAVRGALDGGSGDVQSRRS